MSSNEPTGPLTLRGALPSGPDFAFSMTRQMITLRAGDLICTAHPRWMTVEQALQLADQLKEVGLPTYHERTAPMSTEDQPSDFDEIAANAVKDTARYPDGRIRPAIDRAIRRDHSVCDTPEQEQ